MWKHRINRSISQFSTAQSLRRSTSVFPFQNACRCLGSSTQGNNVTINQSLTNYTRACSFIEKKHYDEAFPLLRQAATDNISAAQGRLGRWYLLGIGPCQVDLWEAHRFLHVAAVNGDGEAQYWLGRMWIDPSVFSPTESHSAPDESQDESQNVNKRSEQSFSSSDAVFEGIRVVRAQPTHHENVFDDLQDRAAAQKQVIKEIKSFRRLARLNRNRARAGLPEASSLDDVVLTNPQIATKARYEEIDPANFDVTKDENRGIYWLHKAAAKDVHEAQILLGNISQSEYEKTLDITHLLMAVRWYRAAAWTNSDKPANEEDLVSLGNESYLADANFNLASLYWKYCDVLESVENTDLENMSKLDIMREAKRRFELAANLGDLAATYWLGVLYSEGNIDLEISIDPPKAMRYFELAAGQGHGGALLHLSRIYFVGDDALNIVPNPTRHRYFLEKAAEAEEPEALFELADMYYSGIGVAIDKKKALEYFLRAGMLGHSTALLNAGAMYYHGSDIGGKNLLQAFQLYQAAGEAGSIHAWENVAAMYALGEGVPQNETAANYIREMVEKMKTLQKE